MSWHRVDDGFPEHPKLGPLEQDPRLWADALALWLAGACYCRRAGTGGFVSDERLVRLTPMSPRRARTVAKALAERAVATPGGAGLFERVEGGYRFHDWEDYGPASERSDARATAAPAQRQPAKGQRYLYFAQVGEEGLIRVATSSNPWARVGDLRASWGRAELLAARVGTREEVEELWERFAHLVASSDRQWYRPGEDLLDYIRSTDRSATGDATAPPSEDTTGDATGSATGSAATNARAGSHAAARGRPDPSRSRSRKGSLAGGDLKTVTRSAHACGGESPPPNLSTFGLLRSGYAQRYEAKLQDAWMSEAANRAEIQHVAAWAERQAELRSQAVPEVVDGFLDALFGIERLRKHRWPWKWVAEDPAKILAEAGAAAEAGEPEPQDELDALLQEEQACRLRGDHQGVERAREKRRRLAAERRRAKAQGREASA